MSGAMTAAQDLAAATKSYLAAHKPCSHGERIMCALEADQQIRSRQALEAVIKRIGIGAGFEKVYQAASDEVAKVFKGRSIPAVTDEIKAQSFLIKCISHPAVKAPVQTSTHMHEPDWASKLPDFDVEDQAEKVPVRLSDGAAKDPDSMTKGLEIGDEEEIETLRVALTSALSLSELDSLAENPVPTIDLPLPIVKTIGTPPDCTITISGRPKREESAVILVISIIAAVQVILVWNVVPETKARMVATNNSAWHSPSRSVFAIGFEGVICCGEEQSGGVVVQMHDAEDKKLLTFSISAVKACIICLDGPRAQTFHKCKHYVTCRKCAMQVTQCPICKTALSIRDRAQPHLQVGGNQDSHKKPQRTRSADPLRGTKSNPHVDALVPATAPVTPTGRYPEGAPTRPAVLRPTYDVPDTPDDPRDPSPRALIPNNLTGQLLRVGRSHQVDVRQVTRTEVERGSPPAGGGRP